jgi:iron complex outermembrane recepter protein
VNSNHRPILCSVNRLSVVGAATLICIGAAYAQTGPAAGGGTEGEAQLQRVEVTASKRLQTLEQIPGAVTALGKDELNLSGANAIEDIQYKVPSLSIVTLYPGSQQIQLRGISSNLGLPTVGIYLDEMPLSSDIVYSGLDINLRDLSRVEVLRGPQGTLYGEGSMGGTIKYVTSNPVFGRFLGEASIDAGSVAGGGRLYRINGMLNAGGERAGIRVVASTEDAKGWIDNRTLGIRDANNLKRDSVRIKGLWAPTDELSLSLLFAHGDTRRDTSNVSGPGGVTIAPVLTPAKDTFDLGNLIVSYDFPGVRLLSSTGYLDRTNIAVVDFTSAFLPLLGLFGVPPGAITAVGSRGVTEFRTLTQELRLNSTATGPLRWTAGVYFRDYDETAGGRSFGQPNPLPFPLFDVDQVRTSKSSAVFGEVSYDVAPSLELTAGLRGFRDKRAQNSSGVTFGTPGSDTASGDFNSTNPRLALLYRLDANSSIYLNAAKGFRSGGFNSQALGGGQPVPPSFKPENLWSYELGGVLANKALLLQWSLYRNEWKDIQSFTFLQGSPATFTTNAGRAAGNGVDLQVTWLASKALDIAAAVGWNDMKYKVTTADKRAGDPVDFVAPVTASASATWRFALAGTSAFVRAEAQYTDAFTVNIRNFGTNDVQSQARTVARFSGGASLSGWDVKASIDNAFNAEKIVMPAYGALAEPIYTAPRTVSFTIGRKF